MTYYNSQIKPILEQAKKGNVPTLQKHTILALQLNSLKQSKQF